MFFKDGKRRIDFVLAYSRGKEDNMEIESKRFSFLNAMAEQMVEIEVRFFFYKLCQFAVKY